MLPLSLVKQAFFLQPMHFEDFSQFEARILKVTHTNHQCHPERFDAVRTKFNQHLSPAGANFHMPVRVDLCVKGVDEPRANVRRRPCKQKRPVAVQINHPIVVHQLMSHLSK